MIIISAKEKRKMEMKTEMKENDNGKGHCRRTTEKEKDNGKEEGQWKRTMTKNAEDGAPAQDGRGVTAG